MSRMSQLLWDNLMHLGEGKITPELNHVVSFKTLS
jgi:hypothetical protein